MKNDLIDFAIKEIVEKDLPDETDDLTRRRLFDYAIAAAVQPEEGRRVISRPWAFFSGGLTAAVAAAAALFIWYGREAPSRNAVEPNRPSSAAVELEEAGEPDNPLSNKLSKAPITLAADGSVEAGTDRMAVKLPTGIDLLLEPECKIFMKRMDSKGIEVDLRRGRVLASVDPYRKGPPFSISTARGIARIKGTILVVEAFPGMSRVTVLRGKVETLASNGKKQSVRAGYAVRLGSIELDRIDPRETAIFWSDVKTLNDFARNKEAVIDLTEKLEEAVTKTEKSPVPSPEQLLRIARQYRMENNWREAEEAYQRLIHTYPSSAEAMTALVSLGDLQLRQLSNPKEALVSYNRYLKSRARVLEREALLGKASALRALNDRQGEADILRVFLDKYPDVLESSDVGRRLDALKK